MKKWIVVLLCLSMLLLPACHKDNITAPTGSDDAYSEWNLFIWYSKQKQDYSVDIQRTFADGSTDQISVSYGSEKFTITDDAGTRTYSHLIIDRTMEKKDDAYHYGDYFFLTDDPDMTVEKYLKGKSLSPTELVLSKTGVADDVECYGIAPKRIEKVFSAFIAGGGYAQQYCKDSFFTISNTDMRSLKAFYNGELNRSSDYVLNRYDYKGNLLCSAEISAGYVDRITEFDDGSFIVTMYGSTLGKEAEVLYYNKKGELQWRYVYPDWHDAQLTKFFKVGDAFYGFGEYDGDSYGSSVDEIYIAKFTKDGELLMDVIAGGSKEDAFVAVEESSNGFTLWGRTESSDGDFPVGFEDNAMLFHVEVGYDLTFSDLTFPVKKQYAPYPYGFYKGVPVGWDDPMFQIKDADRLPEKVSNFSYHCLIPWGTGYVILRKHWVEEYAFSWSSSPPGSYWQIIATCYNASGQPVWQTTSQPYLS